MTTLLILAFGASAHAQTRSLTNPAVGQPKDDKTDATKYAVSVTCTPLTPEEICSVRYSTDPTFADRTQNGSTTGSPGYSDVELKGLDKVATYYIRAKAITRNPVSEGPFSASITYKYGATPPAPPAQPPAPTTELGSSLCSNIKGTTLKSGSAILPAAPITSPNKKYELAYQSDGNLVLYALTPTRKGLWSSGTTGTTPLRTVMQKDGNLVVLKTGSVVAWDSLTTGNLNAFLSLQDDGNLVIYRVDSCKALWSRR